MKIKIYKTIEAGDIPSELAEACDEAIRHLSAVIGTVNNVRGLAPLILNPDHPDNPLGLVRAQLDASRRSLVDLDTLFDDWVNILADIDKLFEPPTTSEKEETNDS